MLVRLPTTHAAIAATNSVKKSSDSSCANNGAISLPYVNNANCPVPSGASIYSDEIAGSTQVCPVSVGETVETKPGNNSGPTAQGLNQRITSWESLNQIVQFQPDGTAKLLDSSSPQLVIIPVLTNQSGQSAWPNGTRYSPSGTSPCSRVSR